MLHTDFRERFALFAAVSIFRPILADDNPALCGLLRNPVFIPDPRFLKIKRMQHISFKARLASNVRSQSFQMRRAEVLIKDDPRARQRHGW